MITISTLTNGLNSLTGEFTIEKKDNTLLTMMTEGKYADKNIQFSIDVQGAVRSDVDVEVNLDKNTAQGTAGGVNISSLIGNKSDLEPTSGYYVSFSSTASGELSITRAGWIDTGSLVDSAGDTKYFSVPAGNPTFSGGNLSGSISVVPSNGSISSVTDNSGVSIDVSGNISSDPVVYSQSVEGYVSKAADDQALAGKTSAIDTSKYYINGVTIQSPTSGTRQFSVTVPNGNTTATFVFNVDSTGNVVITES